jgi:hypothetical protein
MCANTVSANATKCIKLARLRAGDPGWAAIGRGRAPAVCDRVGVVFRRPPRPSNPPPPEDRPWSAHTNIDPGQIGAELVHHTALPAETGPVRAPDRLSVWPLEGGRYGVDAHYHGQTGRERAERQRRRLAAAGLGAGGRVDVGGGGALLRMGPLAHGAVWLALEAFLGRPLPDPDAAGPAGGG